MLEIKLRAYFIVILLVIFIVGMITSGWLITTLGVLSLIGAVIILLVSLSEDSEMSLKEFIFGS